MALELTSENIKTVLEENVITVIDFKAAWCGPCVMLGPIIDELAEDNPDVAIGKVDVDTESEIALFYGIRNIPAILFFKDGELVDKAIGSTTKSVLQGKIDILKN